MRKCLIITIIVLLLLCDIALGFVCWSYHEHGGLPTMVRYSGYYIPIGLSLNRMDDGFYVVAISWKCNTLAFEQNGIHVYGG